jgi:very-short-patch-repair endonuclease
MGEGARRADDGSLADGISSFNRPRRMANVNARTLDHARSLRWQQTQAERMLWNAIRDRRLMEIKFVRQLPVGPYVADFACREAKLIIEVDGATHVTEDERRYDSRRTAFLEKEGYHVLRFLNDDIYKALPVQGLAGCVRCDLVGAG